MRVHSGQKSDGDAPIPDSGNGKDITENRHSDKKPMAGNDKGWRLHLAHHRKRKDSHVVQDRTVGGKNGGSEESAVCGGQAGLGLSDHEGV